ncbi:MAG TPA: radical SAM protein [Pseudolabrys sp.]|nr:radical SAM protein [Pseudolabrys sp.]
MSVAEITKARPAPRRFIKEQDERSIKSAFEIYGAPAGDRRVVQICRPFSVLSAKTYSAAITLPLGVAYLASVLEKAGYRTSILDALAEDIFEVRPSDCGTYNFQGLNADKLVERIDPNAIVLGISMMFSQEWIPHRELINKIRARHPHLIIVAGGEHPTSLPEYTLRDCPAIDFLVTGEGELTFLELVHAIFHGKDPRQVSGVSYLDDSGAFVSGGLSPRIAHIDELPRPAWHLCKVDNYHIGNWTMGISSGRNMPILGTRGCPYQCTFCSNPTMWTTRYTMREPKDVVDEFEFLVKEYGARSVEFFDLTAIVKKEWILAFCNELKKRKLDVSWQLPSGTRSEALDDDTLQAIYDTNCRLLVYAPESGSEESLKLIKKKLKLDRLTQSARTAVKIGHTVKINLIIGFPHEKLRHVISTVLYGIKMAWYGVDDCVLSIFTPYPGSELYVQLRKADMIAPPSDAYFRELLVQFDMTKSTSHTPYISGAALAFWRFAGTAGYYLTAYLCHPRRIVRLLKSLMKGGRFEPNNVFEQRMYDLIVRLKLARSNQASKAAPAE